MFSLDEKEFSANPNLTHKTQTLIIGRLLVVFLLLVASWVWNSGRLKLSFDNFPQGLFLVFLILVGLTIVYFFVLRLSKNFKWQIRVQFLTDMLLITWLIWRTGTSTSPYITLYIVLICVSSIFLSARGTLITAVLCVFLFTVLSVLTSLSLIESHGTALETSKIIQIVAFNCWRSVWSKADALKIKEKISVETRQAKIISWEAEKRIFQISAGNDAKARITTFYYPLWQATVNGNPVEIEKDENGAILIPVSSEKSTVELSFQESLPVRVASILSLLTWLFLGGFLTFLFGKKLFSSKQFV